MINDEKYQTIFATNLTNQRTSAWHRAAVKQVIKAVKADIPKSTSHTINHLKNEVKVLQRKLSKIENKRNAQSWVSVGYNIGKVRGSDNAIKEVVRLMSDFENQRRTIRRLEIKIERYVEQLFNKKPPEPDFDATPPAVIFNKYDVDSTSTTVVNAVKRFFLFGGK